MSRRPVRTVRTEHHAESRLNPAPSSLLGLRASRQDPPSPPPTAGFLFGSHTSAGSFEEPAGRRAVGRVRNGSGSGENASVVFVPLAAPPSLAMFQNAHRAEPFGRRRARVRDPGVLRPDERRLARSRRPSRARARGRAARAARAHEPRAARARGSPDTPSPKSTGQPRVKRARATRANTRTRARRARAAPRRRATSPRRSAPR